MSDREEKLKEKEIQVVIFKLREEEFGIEISSVLEISRLLEITYVPHAPDFVEGVVNLRGKVLAVVDLAKQFGLGEEKERPKSAKIMIVKIKEEIIGLIVDEVPEILRVSEKNIEPPPEIIQTQIKRDYIKGVVKIDQRLILLIDLDKVFTVQEVEEVSGVIKEDKE
jgi:purine-binding chemotaxis protein CheW